MYGKYKHIKVLFDSPTPDPLTIICHTHDTLNEHQASADEFNEWSRAAHELLDDYERLLLFARTTFHVQVDPDYVPEYVREAMRTGLLSE